MKKSTVSSWAIIFVCSLGMCICSCTKSNEAESLLPQPLPQGTVLNLSLKPNEPGLSIPTRFVGLSYEKIAITSPTFFSSDNSVLIQFIKTLGDGVLRIGANEVDKTHWTGKKRFASTPDDSICTTDIDRFVDFVKKTNWPVIFGLNLGTYHPSTATAEAAYIAPKLGNLLMNFEVGNEPDLYTGSGYRYPPYTYDNFKSEFETYVYAIRQSVPGAALSGPAVSYNTKWSVPFASDEKNLINLLTAHHYHMGPAGDSTKTIEKLLSSESSLESLCKKLQTAATSNNMTYRIAECNSVYDGGRPGVSNTLASALWGLDMMWTVAANGGKGVNFHAGSSQIFVYAPFGLVNGTFTARPLYYAMLAFKEAAQGQMIPLSLENAGLNVKAYATVSSNGDIQLTVINKTAASPVSLQVNVGKNIHRLQVQRMQGSSLSATDGVSFAGSQVSSDGHWTASATEYYAANGNNFVLNVAAGSAAVVKVN